MGVELSQALVHALRSRAAKAYVSKLLADVAPFPLEKSGWPLEVAKTGSVVMALSVWSPDEEA